MAAEENRIAHFRRIVEALSPPGRDGKPMLREGYQAVADASGLTYDYVYQVYNGKSGKKGLGKAALEKVSEAFAEGRPKGWMDLPVATDDDLNAEFEPPVRPPTLEEAWMTLASALASLTDLGREFAAPVVGSLAKNPESAAAAFQTFEALIAHHTAAPENPPPTRPKTKTPASAAAKATGGKAALVLKIGGGQKQQFDLPLVRNPFRAESASPRERAWYDKVRAVPKASDTEEP